MKWRDFIRHVWKHSEHPLRALWHWARRGGRKGEVGRWHALVHWAEHHESEAWKTYRKTQKPHDKAVALHWHKMRRIYIGRRKRAYRRWKKHQHQGGAGSPQYATWMLNGHSSNIDDDLKPVVAFVVVVRDQVVTDTYDYGGHVSSSLHYPRNDPTPPQQGHAIDSAGADMCGSMTATRDHFSGSHFLELFGPCNWYIKNGAQFGGMFPGHGDHQHSGVA